MKADASSLWLTLLPVVVMAVLAMVRDYLNHRHARNDRIEAGEARRRPRAEDTGAPVTRFVADAFAWLIGLFWSDEPLLCERCHRHLKGPEVELGGYVVARHYVREGERAWCVGCYEAKIAERERR